MNQENAVLNHLLEHGKIDAITALKKYGCFRLASRIWYWRNEGYKITTRRVTHPFEKNKSFAVYELSKEDRKVMSL